MTEETKEAPEYTTLKTFLLGGGVRLPIGEIELKTGTPLEKYANAAYRRAANSCKRLMTPDYSIVVVFNDTDNKWPLQHWIPLLEDGKKVKK